MLKENILVIDDEKNIRTTLTKCLRAEGYEVTAAINGEDGLEKLSEEDFDLILGSPRKINLPTTSRTQRSQRSKEREGK